MPKPFRMSQKVLFRHCDPAGIVFFPRYFEMMNDCVEAFFAEALGAPFEKVLVTHGLPTAGIETQFKAPSFHGNLLRLELSVLNVGKTSFKYRMTAQCGDELRFETSATLVHVTHAGKPHPWPEDLRTKLAEYEDAT